MIGRSWRLVCGAASANPNTLVFALGLIVLCGSVARWSAPLAGALCGVVLMVVAAWPVLSRMRKD